MNDACRPRALTFWTVNMGWRIVARLSESGSYGRDPILSLDAEEETRQRVQASVCHPHSLRFQFVTGVGGGRDRRTRPYFFRLNCSVSNHRDLMSIRITSESDLGETVLYIAGKLQNEDLGELEREIGNASSPLVLDLSDLTFADQAGTNALTALLRCGTELRGMSPYWKLLLEQDESSG